MGELRIGTSGWSYPTGQGTWNGLFYPPRKGRASSVPGLRRARLLRRALRHRRGELELLRHASARGQPRLGAAHAARIRVLAEAVSEVHPPRMFKASRLGDLPATPEELDALARVNRADIDQFKAGIDPLASADRLGALLAQFPPSFKDTPQSRAYLEWLLTVFRDYPVVGRAAAQQLERSRRRHADAAERVRRRVDADRRAEVPLLDPPEPAAEREDVLLHAAARPERGAVVEARREPRIATTTCTQTDELQPIAETATAARAHREEGLSLHEQSLRREIRRERGGASSTSRGTPIEGVYPQALVERYDVLAPLVKTRASWAEVAREQPADVPASVRGKTCRSS